jgi:PilZ domain
MKDVSATGAKLELQTQSEIPDEVTLVLSKYGNVRRKCIVSWRSNAAIGVRFVGS